MTWWQIALCCGGGVLVVVVYAALTAGGRDDDVRDGWAEEIAERREQDEANERVVSAEFERYKQAAPVWINGGQSQPLPYSGRLDRIRDTEDGGAWQ